MKKNIIIVLFILLIILAIHNTNNQINHSMTYINEFNTENEFNTKELFFKTNTIAFVKPLKLPKIEESRKIDSKVVKNSDTQHLTSSNQNPTNKEKVNVNEIVEEKQSSNNLVYTQEELELIARIIFAEAGSDHLSDEHQRAVASVVINRKNDNRFPNSIKEVVYQTGQYGCVYNGMINRTPNQRAYDNAKYVLENGVTIPSNVVWQSGGKQGVGVYKYIQGHYFCY